MTYIFFNRHPVLKASGQCHFISIFQLTAKSNSAGNGGNADTVMVEAFFEYNK